MNNMNPTTPPVTTAWISAVRPATLLVGVVPVAVGAAVATRGGPVDLSLAGAALVGALGLQIGCNLVNDAADFASGADGDDRLGPARAAQRGWLSERALWAGAAACFLLAGLAGAVLIRAAGWPIAAIGAAGLVAAIGYTAGPVRLGYLGLGDVLVFAFFGWAAVCGTDFALRGAWSLDAALACLPVGGLATAVLVVNNLRDRFSDARAGKRTLAVRLGERFARREYAALVALAYATPSLATLAGRGGWGWWLPTLSAPLALRAVRGLRHTDGAALNPYLGATARLMTVYGALLALGLSLQSATGGLG